MMNAQVFIVDYGMGNLASVQRAVEELGARVVISEEPKDIKTSSHLILPGVGAFGDGMRNLQKLGWDEALVQVAQEKKLAVLGICLGMQLLADVGFEHGEHRGLGLIPGKISKLNSQMPHERIPHVGWNELHFLDSHDPLLSGIRDKTDFYFVHSYHFLPENSTCVLAKTPYCGDFVSVVRNELIWGVQFHPEKSARPGFQLLKNFLEAC
ncbi:MAG: imidazole glycerol phosphate synthase subunit HisH [Candidatus Sericytochromatia bacterium]